MIFTEYCCRLLLGCAWEETSKHLDEFIKNNTYDEGEEYIQSLDFDADTKRKLINCLLSYKYSC